MLGSKEVDPFALAQEASDILKRANLKSTNFSPESLKEIKDSFDKAHAKAEELVNGPNASA